MKNNGTNTLKRNMTVEEALSEIEDKIKPDITKYIMHEVANMRGEE